MPMPRDISAIESFLRKGMNTKDLIDAFGPPDGASPDRPGENWDEVWQYFADNDFQSGLWIQIEGNTIVGWVPFDFSGNPK
jgi:hypothetical protein